MENKKFGYARVSAWEQNIDRQVKAFEDLVIDRRNIITDKESGKDINRANYLALRNNMLRAGDTLIIKSLDRLGRNKDDIKKELEFFKNNKIRLKVIELPITMTELPEGSEWIFDMVNNIMIDVLGTIAEQERRAIKQRQAEGIAVAREKGIVFGRPKVEKPEHWDKTIGKWRNKEITAEKAMEILKMKPATFYKLLKK